MGVSLPGVTFDPWYTLWLAWHEVKGQAASVNETTTHVCWQQGQGRGEEGDVGVVVCVAPPRQEMR